MRKRKIFFGWWTVLTSGFLALTIHGYYTYGISALFKPIASELNLDRTATSVPSSIGRLEGGFEGPVVGWLVDKIGPRRLVAGGVAVVSLALIMMNFVNSLWQFYVVWGVILGTGFNFATTLPMHKAISNWFVKRRGLALSIMMVFSGASGVIVMPLIAWMLITQSWRTTCLIGGVVIGVIGIPLSWLFFRDQRPEYYGLLPDGAVADDTITKTEQMIDRGTGYAAELNEYEFSLKQAIRTPAYWLIAGSYAMQTLVTPAIQVHTIPFLTDRGIGELQAAGMMAFMLAVSLPSRLFGGIVADRLDINKLRFLTAGAYLIQAIGITVFLLNQESTAAIYVWFILYGLGIGVGFTMNSILVARYFGRKAFGSIQGVVRGITAPAGIAAPVFAGWIYDTTGNYIIAFTAFTGMLVVGAVIASFARPPKPPSQITRMDKLIRDAI